MRRALLFSLAAACGSGSGAEAELPPWSAELPPAPESYGERRGLTPARGIIHLHSPLSHDACDGEPRDEETGAIDESCLTDLREALCATRVDYAALTDHDATMADEAYEDLFLARAGDERVGDASRIHCEGGHTVLLYAGGENALMPIMIDRHPEGSAEERHAIYDAEDPETVQLFRELGGLVVIPHAESRSLETLRALEPDGMEIYNLHANIDPDIREEHLGLDGAGAIEAVAEFADTSEEGPEPDLALLSFFAPNAPSVERWEALLGEGRRLIATAGTDAHQNALPLELRDGERADSYRRMIRWFSNVALVEDPDDPALVQEAVAAGRSFLAFELFGTPSGFDVFAEGPGGTVELGGEVPAGAGYTLEVRVPEVYGLDASLPAPEIRARILRVDAAGSHEVAAGAGPALRAPIDRAGAWRAEIRITPRHHGPRLGRLGPEMAEREHVWIYANPIYAVE